MAIGLAFAALRSMNIMILARFAPTAETAMYGAALNFIDLLFLLPLIAQRAFLPVFSRTTGWQRGIVHWHERHLCIHRSATSRGDRPLCTRRKRCRPVSER